MFGEPEISLVNLICSYLGKLSLRKHDSGSSTNCDEAVFGVQKTSLDMLWELFVELTNLASDWLKPDSSPMEEEKTGTATHIWQCECFQPLALDKMASFVAMWEGEHYLWDPADKDK